MYSARRHVPEITTLLSVIVCCIYILVCNLITFHILKKIYVSDDDGSVDT